MYLRRYGFFLMSAVLLALALYPFGLWPLALIALAPLFYAAAAPRPRREIFFGGFLCGAVAVAPTLYYSLAQLELQPGAPTLTLAVRLSSVFFLIFIGTLFGALAYGVSLLRSPSPLRNTLVAASLYTILELILFAVFGGYYYASVAHALASFPPALALAAWGGVPLVIFCAAWMSAALAERSWKLLLGGVCLMALLWAGQWGLELHSPQNGVLAASLIQRQPQELYDLLVPAEAPFADPSLASVISDAAAKAPFVIYPFSPVDATYKDAPPQLPPLPKVIPDEALGGWLTNIVPASTTVMLWNTVSNGGNLYDEFEFWQNEREQEYQKHELYALSDYAPSWLRGLGLARLPYEITPGTLNAVSVGGVRLGSLACSELQQEWYARAQAAHSSVLLSVGFDGMFPGTLASGWSLEAARLRAAENGTPLLRSYIFGPSAFIAADGSITASMPAGQGGVLYGTVALKKIPTLYALLGPLLPIILIIASLAWALWNSIRARGNAGQ